MYLCQYFSDGIRLAASLLKLAEELYLAMRAQCQDVDRLLPEMALRFTVVHDGVGSFEGRHSPGIWSNIAWKTLVQLSTLEI